MEVQKTMETLDCIEKRTSVRKYLPHTMNKEEIHKIISAAMQAPSAMNRRPYEMIVNTDNAFWSKFKDVKPTCEIAASASLTILVIGDSNTNPTNEFLLEDCSCLSENALLAATELGYGSLWAGIKWDSDFQKRLVSYFHLPDGFIPISLLIIGKTGEKKTNVDRFDAKKVHLGKW
jgi:nitroreductase